MSNLTTEHRGRIQGSYQLELDEQTIERHLAAIEAEIRAPAAPAATSRSRWIGVRAAVLAAATIFVVLPLSGAIASDQAVPGDVLYPIKRAIEPVVSLFISDVAPSHRVEELEELVDRGADRASVEEAAADAVSAVSDVPADSQLRDRLDRVLDRIDRRAVSDAPPARNDEEPPASDGPADRDPTRDDAIEPGTSPPDEDSTPSTTEPDTPTTTTRPSDRDTDPETSTTTKPDRGDEPPPDQPPGDGGRGDR